MSSRSKISLTTIDCLRGQPRPIQRGRLPHPFISFAPAPPGRCSPAARLPPRASAMGAPAPSPRRPWVRPSSLPPPASAPRCRGLSPPPSPRRPGPPPPPSPRRRPAAGRIRAWRGVAPPPAARTKLGPSLWPPAMAGHGAAMATAAPPPSLSLSLPPPSLSLSLPPPSLSLPLELTGGERAEQGRARAAGERPPCSRRAVSRAAPPHLELAHALAPAARRRCGRRRCQGGGGGPPSAPARRESSEGARPSQAAEPRGGAPAKAGGGATGSPPRR